MNRTLAKEIRKDAVLHCAALSYVKGSVLTFQKPMRCNSGKALATPEADQERGRDRPEPLAEFKDGGSPEWRLPVLALISALVSVGFGSGVVPPSSLVFVGAVDSPLHGVSGVVSGVTVTLGCAPVGRVSRVQPADSSADIICGSLSS